MKTQQEIVLKAKEYAESIGSKDGTCMYDYAMGYTKCQEDMDAKKYTENDIYMALEFGRSHSSMTDKQFIESLNKQD